MQKERYVPVGIFDKEIYLARLEDGKLTGSFDVLRYVTQERLEKYRDPDNIRDYLKEDWKAAVQKDMTEDSLDDFVDEAMQEYDLDDNEEMYPGKDESGMENLGYNERDEADDFIQKKYGEEVGTWEFAGWYAPVNSFTKRTFRRFDYVFKNKEAKRLAEEYLDSLEP